MRAGGDAALRAVEVEHGARADDQVFRALDEIQRAGRRQRDLDRAEAGFGQAAHRALCLVGTGEPQHRDDALRDQSFSQIRLGTHARRKCTGRKRRGVRPAKMIKAQRSRSGGTWPVLTHERIASTAGRSLPTKPWKLKAMQASPFSGPPPRTVTSGLRVFSA